LKRDMTTGKEWKLILLFTLPLMAGSFLQQLYSIIDGIIVGRFVSEQAFASVATCHSLVFLYLSLSLGISVGVNIVVSQYFGAGKKDQLGLSISTALLLVGAAGLVLTIAAVIFSELLLVHLLSVPADLLADSLTYMRVYSFGLFFTFMYNGIAAILRGFGDSKATLYFLLIATVLSTVLTFLFVLVIQWGVAGAAFSTVLAQAVCAVISYIYLRKRYRYENNTGKHFDFKIAATMFKLGAPIAIQMGIVSIGHGTMQRLVNAFELTIPGVVAAYGAAIRVDMLVLVPVMAFQSGLASFAGQNIGAGNLERAKRGLYSTLIMSLIVTVTVSILLYIFANNVVGLFGLTGSSLTLGYSIIRFMVFFFWIFALYMVAHGLLQGAGDTVVISIATLTALAIRVAGGYIAVHFGWLGPEAAWVTMPIGWVFGLIITYIRYFSGAWKTKAVAGRLKKAPTEDAAN